MQFITDSRGRKISVVLPVRDYQNILEELEELEDIRLYDAVKARNEDRIPFNLYLKQRNKKKNGKV